jgi:signal transduction histidine kinase
MTHTSHWGAFLDALPKTSPVSDAILESWQRCRAAGLDRALHADHFRSVDAPDLAERLRLNADLIDIARSHLDWLGAQLATVPHVVYLVDEDGIVLLSSGDPELIAYAHLAPGADWSERTMGTNGAGTAIASRRPVAVVGPDHFDRRWHDCTCTAAPIRHPDGGVIGAVDVTTSVEHARPEQLVIVSHVSHAITEALALRGRARTAETAANLGRLASFMAHEIASPLDALHGTLEAISDGAADPDRFVARALALTTRMTATVSDLRLLGGDLRLRRGGVARERVELRDLVAASQSLLPRTRGVSVAMPPDLERVEVAGHRGLLVMALRNLLANAAAASPVGQLIGIAAERTDDAVRLTVWDDGDGIPESARGRLFREPMTTKPSGSGIGLLLVRTIVEQIHGGHVAYEPRVPRGSAFILTLPVAPAAG